MKLKENHTYVNEKGKRFTIGESDPEFLETIENFMNEMEDLDPKYCKIINDNLWDLA